MMKTTLAVMVIGGALTAVPIVTPVKAQVDMKTGLHIDDPAGFRERNSSATIGVGGGVSVGRPQEYTPKAPLRPKRRAAKR